ncbi:unnamed protein product [Amoebophrya sp. A25]|nr:unnamed protein product [Amoebophrya sp. A25]|eukprot:GSA25T00000337001.1
MWKKLFIDLLRNDGRVSTGLPLCCPRHSWSKRRVECPEDMPDPYGTTSSLLCTEVCGRTIPECGHKCEQPCHAGDCLRAFCRVVILQHCPVAPKEHPPRKLLCGVIGDQQSSNKDEGMFGCNVEVDTKCAHCGKTLKKKCGEVHRQKVFYCRVKQRCSRNPRHTFERACNETADVCPKRCGKLLSCGHPCPLRCYEDCSRAECKKTILQTCAAELHKMRVYCKDIFPKQMPKSSAFMGHGIEDDKETMANACSNVEHEDVDDSSLICKPIVEDEGTKKEPRLLPSSSSNEETTTNHTIWACKQEVQFRCAKCGQTLTRRCYEREEDVRCEHYCRKKLPFCPHLCTRLCWEDCPASREGCAICREDEKSNFFAFLDDWDEDEQQGLWSSSSSQDEMIGVVSSLRKTPWTYKTLHLHDILYSQRSISDHFRDGRCIHETLRKLRDDPELLNKFPQIEVVSHDIGYDMRRQGQGGLKDNGEPSQCAELADNILYLSMDNRRLWLLKQLHAPDRLVEVKLFHSSKAYGENWFNCKFNTRESIEDLAQNRYNQVRITPHPKFSSSAITISTTVHGKDRTKGAFRFSTSSKSSKSSSKGFNNFNFQEMKCLGAHVTDESKPRGFGKGTEQFADTTKSKNTGSKNNYGLDEARQKAGHHDSAGEEYRIPGAFQIVTAKRRPGAKG